MTLMVPYLKKGHNLYTDNWYTSPILCQHLYIYEVYMLSSLYDSSSANTNKTDRASGKVVKKPTCIVNYNACMGKIDKM